MNCEMVKELLITDYIDNELDAERQGLVKAHLAKCPVCSAFEAEMRRTVVEPFKSAKPAKPRDEVWRNIADSIKSPASPRRQFSSRPVFLAAALAVILIAAVVFLHGHYTEQKSLDLYIEEELGYLSSVDTNNVIMDEDLI